MLVYSLKESFVTLHLCIVLKESFIVLKESFSNMVVPIDLMRKCEMCNFTQRVHTALRKASWLTCCNIAQPIPF